MKKILDNYISVNRAGYDFIAKNCYDWADAGITNPTNVFEGIVNAGGCLTKGAIVGQHLFGNMYNAENDLAGEVWVTAEVISLETDDNGFLWAKTKSGSSYLLLEAHKDRCFDVVYFEILGLAPDSLREYLESHAPFWAPEIVWVNLTNAINRFVEPSSSDKLAVSIYAVLCDCTEEEMIRRFKEDGL